MRFLLSKWTIKATVAISLLLCFTLVIIAKRYDISHHTIITCNKKLPGNVWLVSYADGSDIHFQNQNYLTQSAFNKCIDFYKPYNSSHIDPDYQKSHAKILSQVKGAGYWLWKPYLILKTLKEIPENDIVFYVDSGASLRKPIDGLVNHLVDHDIIVFKSYHLNKKYVKRYCLKTMNADYEQILNLTGVQASFIIIKNTKFSRDFIEQWLKLCEDEKMLTDLPDLNEYPEFIAHTHDQSILSLLVLDYPKNIYVLPYESGKGDYFFHHRRRQDNAQHPLSIWEYILMN